MTSKNFIELMESNVDSSETSVKDIRNSLMALNTMRKKRWQIVSDDHVWFYPPDVSVSTVELDSFVYKETPYESCVFFANGDSDVVARYKTQTEALLGHIELEKKYSLKRISIHEFNV